MNPPTRKMNAIAARRPVRAADRRAITSVEMVVVVLVLGILASVGMPKYRESFAHWRIEAASRRVASDLRMARDYALRTSAPQLVDFDATTESYAAPTMADPDRPSNPYSVSISKLYSVDVFSSVFGPGDAVQFDIHGRPDRTGVVTLRHMGKQRTVEVDSAGQVRIP